LTNLLVFIDASEDSIMVDDAAKHLNRPTLPVKEEEFEKTSLNGMSPNGCVKKNCSKKWCALKSII